MNNTGANKKKKRGLEDDFIIVGHGKVYKMVKCKHCEKNHIENNGGDFFSIFIY